ncbi:hypothetical protein [Thermomonospora echinospora]|uniref:hypothetical protein n=1 Tax=Thermomonospora echinospora TaxID=1992 RepID=UPI001F158C52|nr:hypothetical protein [Thermomonospora echinospora]
MRTEPHSGRDLALPALREVYRAYVRAAGGLPALPDPLRAELWTSTQLGALESAAPHAAGHRLAMGDLIAELHRAAAPGTRAFLLGIAAIGPQWARRAAGKAAAALRDLPAPPWADALGQVTPGPAWLIQEGPLDGDRLVLEFRYGPEHTGPHHALAVRLMQDSPTEIVVVGDVAAMMADARKAVQAELCTVQPVAQGAAAGRLRAALDTGTPPPEDCYPALALARHRAAVIGS